MLVKIEEIQERGLHRSEPIKRDVLEEAMRDSDGYTFVSSTPLVCDFERLSGRVHVKGTYDATVSAQCKRCLKDVELTVPVSFSLRMIAEKHGGRGDDDDVDDGRADIADIKGLVIRDAPPDRKERQSRKAKHHSSAHQAKVDHALGGIGGAAEAPAESPAKKTRGAGSKGKPEKHEIHETRDDPNADLAASFELDEIDAEPFDGKTINMDPIVREQTLLALPLSVLCEDDCKGLCIECGQNLNLVACGHSGQKMIDPRLAKLRDIKLKN